MQERHTNREQYFEELAQTCRKYYIPYLQHYMFLNSNVKVLEIGCGDGGNLLPFLEIGCDVTGVDISATRISQAKTFLEERKNLFSGSLCLSCKNIFLWDSDMKFDIILVHDVIEHIVDKLGLLQKMEDLLSDNGLVLCGFPAWMMPFGGHQQICRSKVLSHLPFVHLLPNVFYKLMIRACGESEARVEELLDIKKCRTTVESFEKLLTNTSLSVVDRTLWLVNPHYEIKFKIHPRKLVFPFDKIPYIRNFFSTSCFYLLSKKYN